MFDYTVLVDSKEAYNACIERKVNVAVTPSKLSIVDNNWCNCLISPWEMPRKDIPSVVAKFGHVVFGPYSERAEAFILHNNVTKEVQGGVTWVENESALMGVNKEDWVAISPKKDAVWDHCSLAGRSVWLMPMDDPREQWLQYCDLRQRGVNVGHVVIGGGVWKDGLLSSAYLNFTSTIADRKTTCSLNALALSIFWGLEVVRRGG